jgi:putative membrane-bound dehydrogenase-like protein
MNFFIRFFVAALIGTETTIAAEAPVMAGAATADLTPDYPVRLCGYASRKTPHEGVEQKLFGKAFAMGSAERGDLTLVITVDTLGVPAAVVEKIYAGISARTKLAREQFAVCASHTHSAPMLAGMCSNIFGMDIPQEQWDAINRYTAEITDKLITAGLEAIRDERPGELYWGMGRAGFAKNRRTEGGPVDHEAPILAAKVDGKWKAVLVNYACHCTTLGGEFNKTCGDWAGFAQAAVEQNFPGATALVAVGCGGDANPFPRGTLALADEHGKELATEAGRLLKGELKRLRRAPKGAMTRFNLAFDTLPTREKWEELAKDQGAIGYHARKNLARLDRGEKLPTELPYSVEVWAFDDDFAMVFLPGEVVVDYSLRAKRSYAAHRVWVNAYSNDEPCYIPSRRIWSEGGYEGGGAMIYYDLPTRLAEDTEERIFAALDRVMPAAFKVSIEQQNEQKPKSPSEALKTFRLPAGFEIELVASEPLIIDPVAIDFAADGRLWVAEMHDYPLGIDGKFKPGGRIKVLSSTQGDGHFDRADTLVDDVPFPTGVMAWKKGALVCAAPNILYIEDTDGDGRADVRKILYSGFATHNYQARVNCLRWGLDGWLYGAAGLFGGTIRSELTGKTFALSGRDFRIKPDTGEFEPVAGLSQQGRVRDDFGNWFGCDNGTWMWHFPLPDEYLARNPNIAYPESRVSVARGPNANEVYPASVTLERFNDPDNANHTTSACGLEIYRDVALGNEFYHNAFTPEPVHNLVHRLVVHPAGTTFSGLRPEGEERSEFLASTDNWFRPAETRTGPDGALWVVDMYRFVIEHPRWISSNRLAQLDVRAGDQQGRIYRVRRAGDKSTATWGDLTRKSDAELVAILGANNGVLRDLAHRLLLERGGKSTAGAVKNLVKTAQSAGARLQALHLLEQLGGVDEALLRGALADKEAPVRAAAVRISEHHLKDHTIPAMLLRMAGDTDPAVRLQLALTYGEIAGAGEALGKIAVADLGDVRMRYAVLSSATKTAPETLEAVLNASDKAAGRREMVDGLIRTAAASSEPRIRDQTLALALPRAGQPFEGWRLDAANSLLSAGGISKSMSARLESVRGEARKVATDNSRDLHSREVALEILGRLPGADHDFELFADLLRADSAELQKAALGGLRKSPDARAADLLLANWQTKSPSMRRAIVTEMLQRENWTDRLLASVEKGAVNAREIGPTERQQLIRHTNKSLADRATKLLESGNSDRGAVIASYAKVAELSGNPNRGLATFAANCSSCHAFRGVGFAVGPDLATYHDKPVADFLVAILNPNAVIEPRFINYQVETKDDRSLSGVLNGETATSVTLIGANGAKETLLRSQITSIKASGFSLMPEGFETVLDAQSLADLIAYLKLGAPPAFGSARQTGAGDARRDFLHETQNSGPRILFASELLDYPSPFGMAPLHHCRQIDSQSRVEWECPAPKLDADNITFQFPVAMGLQSQPAGTFLFEVNGKKAFDFNVTLHDTAWASADGIRATYRVYERNAEDSSGVLRVEIPVNQLPPGRPIRFKVTATAADSQRWFGIYALDSREVVKK